MKSGQADAKRESNLTELIAAIRAGDQQAFTRLYEMTSQEVYRTARAVLRNEEEALDVQQDTFVFAYNHLDQLSEPEKVRPWLRAIAVNRAKSVLRRQTPVLFTELENEEGEGLPEQADLSPESSPELSLERKETAELVNEILEELSDGQRAAVAMYYYEQMSVGEISEALGVAPGTVKAQLARGRKKIEEAVHRLEKQGVKLYGLSPIPFLLALMRRQAPAAQAGEAILTKTLAQTGLAAGTKAAVAAGSGAATAPLAEVVVLHTTRPFFTTALGKLVLGVICVGVVGGSVAGYHWVKHIMEQKTTSILTLETSEHLQNDPTEPTLPVELDVPAVPETEAESGEDEQKLWGSCGEDLNWTLFKDSGKLVLQGSGDMTDYPDAQSVPWAAYQSEIRDLRLPAELTGIGDYAFSGCTALAGSAIHVGKTACLPDGLTRIGDHAFSGCTALEADLLETLLPETLTSIGDGAFSGCAALRTVMLPNSVLEIGVGAFAGCDELQRIWIRNQDCSIGAELGDLSGLTICGIPGSTAEQYATENGASFNPMEDDREALTEYLKTEGSQGARIVSATPIDTRYLVKAVPGDADDTAEGWVIWLDADMETFSGPLHEIVRDGANINTLKYNYHLGLDAEGELVLVRIGSGWK